MSFVFNGTTQYLSASASFGLTLPFTVGLWVKQTDVSETQFLYHYANDTINEYFNSAYLNSNNTIIGSFSMNGNTRNVITTGTISASTWTPIVLTARIGPSDDDLQLYALGETPSNGNALGIAADSSPLITLGAKGGGSFYLGGKLAEVMVWNSELSSENITNYLNADDPDTIDSANQIAYWKADGSTSADLTDSVGSIVLVNSTSVTYDSADNPPIGGGTSIIQQATHHYRANSR